MQDEEVRAPQLVAPRESGEKERERARKTVLYKNKELRPYLSTMANEMNVILAGRRVRVTRKVRVDGKKTTQWLEPREGVALSCVPFGAEAVLVLDCDGEEMRLQLSRAKITELMLRDRCDGGFRHLNAGVYLGVSVRMVEEAERQEV
ncbi:MAG: hypothetical protein LUC33_05080 [Prevotellaceae bacterium]|nr:hypothetical protein [Prevotellaceae bacterium]